MEAVVCKKDVSKEIPGPLGRLQVAQGRSPQNGQFVGVISFRCL